jgi:hypothetical protein
MTIKEKIVRQAIDTATKKLKEIKFLLSANPLGRICEIRIETQKILQKHGNDHSTISGLLKPLAGEEKRLFVIAKKQKNTMALIDKQCALTHELYALGHELYSIEKLKE